LTLRRSAPHERYARDDLRQRMHTSASIVSAAASVTIRNHTL
jgi:hypothetical protein